MKLDNLCEAFEALPFPGARDQSDPDRDAVAAARNAVAAAVIDDEFLVDCISRELRRLEADRLNWGLEPFFTIPSLGIRLAFGYWPPGGSAGPHEHTAWTITAVCRNRLEVLTYDRQESYRRKALVPKNRFEAQAGRTGFIYEPCIHEPRNPSTDWSLSLHASSPRGEERPADSEWPFPGPGGRSGHTHPSSDHPYTRIILARCRNRFIHELARILAPIGTPQASLALEQLLGFAPSATRKILARSMPGPGPGGRRRRPGSSPARIRT